MQIAYMTLFCEPLIITRLFLRIRVFIADQLGLKDIEQQAINYMVGYKLDADIIDGKEISHELMRKLFKSVFNKLKEKY